MIYKWWGEGFGSNGDALPVGTDHEGSETTLGETVPVDTTTLLKGVSSSAIVAADEIKLTDAEAEAFELPEVLLVTVLELDAEPSILVDSAVSVNKFRYTGIKRV